MKMNGWINSAIADKAKMQFKELLFESKGTLKTFSLIF